MTRPIRTLFELTLAVALLGPIADPAHSNAAAHTPASARAGERCFDIAPLPAGKGGKLSSYLRGTLAAMRHRRKSAVAAG